MKTRYDGAATLRFEAVYDNRTPTDLPSRLVLFPTFLLRKRICLMAVSLHCIAHDGNGWCEHENNEPNCHIDARASRNYDERDWFGPRPRIRRV